MWLKDTLKMVAEGFFGGANTNTKANKEAE
jgi:hypothetical protein